MVNSDSTANRHGSAMFENTESSTNLTFSFAYLSVNDPNEYRFLSVVYILSYHSDWFLVGYALCFFYNL